MAEAGDTGEVPMMIHGSSYTVAHRQAPSSYSQSIPPPMTSEYLSSPPRSASPHSSAFKAHLQVNCDDYEVRLGFFSPRDSGKLGDSGISYLEHLYKCTH